MHVSQVCFLPGVLKQWPLPNIPRTVTEELEVVVPPELPATSTVQANLTNQPTLLLSQDHHAASVLLMTNPGEPSIPHSVREKPAQLCCTICIPHLVKKTGFPFSPLYSAFTSEKCL